MNYEIDLLDYFAGLAMQEVIRKQEPGKAKANLDLISKWAYDHAESMVKERAERPANKPNKKVNTRDIIFFIVSSIVVFAIFFLGISLMESVCIPCDFH